MTLLMYPYSIPCLVLIRDDKTRLGGTDSMDHVEKLCLRY